MVTYLRADRAVIRFSGQDAQKLLQDVVTGRILSEPGPAVWWALLSPQGKIQAEGLSGFDGEAFWFDVGIDVADAFLKRMKMYRLRAQVTIDDLRETHRVGWSPGGAEGNLVHADPRGGGLGLRVIVPLEDTAGWESDPLPWLTSRIALGIAEQGPDFDPDSTYPHDIGMDLNAGVDFKKGCYVGQEVVSRMQHRGTARRRPVIVEGTGLESGAALVSDGRDAGTLGAVAGDHAIAIVRLDRIAHEDAASVDDAPVTLTLPAWASYHLGESAAAE